jgi:hypothetical protein
LLGGGVFWEEVGFDRKFFDKIVENMGKAPTPKIKRYQNQLIKAIEDTWETME